MARERSFIQALFKQLIIIYWSMLTGQLLLFAVSYYLIFSGSFAVIPELHGMFQYFVPAYSILLIGISHFFYTRLLRSAKKQSQLPMKLLDYRRATILRVALVGGLNIFIIIIFLFTGLNYYVYFFIGLLLLFIVYRPQQSRLRATLELSEEEEELIRKG